MSKIENNINELDIDKKIQENYQSYMNNLTVDDDFHKRLLRTPQNRPKNERSTRKTMKNFALVAASLCILVLGAKAISSLPSYGDSTKDCAPAPMDESNSKNEYAVYPEDSTAKEDSQFQTGSQFESDAGTYVDHPMILSGTKTTYQDFIESYTKANRVTNEQSDHSYKLVEKPSKEVINKLTSKLPKSLNSLDTVKQEVFMAGSNTALTTCLRSSTASNGLLYVSIHPVLDFELDLYTSSVTQYSLNREENPSLPSSKYLYSGTLLYPIFVEKPITREMITSRQYETDGNITYSFGISQGNYVITVEAINFPIEELISVLN